MGRLQGKTALVTGAGRDGNIGVAICEAFLREGCAGVIATDLRSGEAAAISARMEAEFGGGRFVFVEHDVADESSWAKVVDVCLESFGALDILVNNAGISVHGGVQSTSLETMRRVMAVNHDALFLGMKTCLPPLARSHLRFAEGGAVINNISMASYMPNPRNLGYAVSKAAARMLTLCAAEEFGPQRVRVNSIHPGVTMTPLIEEGLAEYVKAGRWTDREEAESSLVERTPLRMTSRPADVAHAFVFLASAEARFVTGASINHDGGLGRVY
ncbi:SDR family NAD(P)-dependent oxidoreductase [Gordonia terrae]|uniref:KR domain-containing protein n=2 Tax=Gordonia terrae TaxID=2055 RepID=A0AAD0NWR9_9ACTN|nr:SDR family oxidoreductase [Gordonia terrae]ANY22217.1 cyclopentanol dehydrogenase [Gordonia terrae]AWO82958.1 KR domain-containing protein [Gordonia terrae]GAB46315.1 putative cyclopentanol dehydrogenase [Gordonia terrae NBRC 100016]VTS29889.1 Glucose 1-dehydrogenase 2 [Gordonia terrae]